MEQVIATHVIATKSWLAYARVVVGTVLAVAFLALAGLVLRQVDRVPDWAGLVVLGLVAAVLVRSAYDVVSLHRVRIVADPSGIWLSSGVLPWDRGLTQGVRWRDCAKIEYSTGFHTYLTHSGTVTIEHRYTLSSGVVARDMAEPKRAVQQLYVLLEQHERGAAY